MDFKKIKLQPVYIKVIAAICAVCILAGVVGVYAASRAHRNTVLEGLDESELESFSEPDTEEEALPADTAADTAPVTAATEAVTTPPETAPVTEAVTETAPVTEYIAVTSIELDRYSLNLKVGEYEMPMVTMYPREATNQGEIWESSDTSVAVVNRYGNVTAKGVGECTVRVTSDDNRNVYAEVSVTVTEAPAPQVSVSTVTEPTYINGILIVNKTYALPSDYNPGVDPTAYAALTEMFAAAAQEGLSLWVASGFRSYDRQVNTYNNYVAADGKAAADTYSARPGHSEHQSGLAFDLNSLYQSFGSTPEGIWLANNCWKYGFIIRFPQGKESITGYMYEPWHVRYVGVDAAKAIYESGLCLEEYLGVTSVYADN